MDKIGDKKAIKYRLRQTLEIIPNSVKLLYRLYLDKRVAVEEKALLLATIAYVISPMDFLPDIIPFMGQVDDLLLIALVFRRLLNAAGEELVMSHWDGDPSILSSFNFVVDWTEYVLPAGIYSRIVKRAGQEYEPVEYYVLEES